MSQSRLKMLATITLCSLLGACASTQTQPQIKQQQEETLQRWVNCVDRQSEFGSTVEVLSRVDLYCEGHKRDLLAAYPAHLETRVSELLSQRAQKIANQQATLNLQ